MTANAHFAVICERCGKSFHVKPSRPKRFNARYCSRACRTDDPNRFWAQVDVRGRDECWPWRGSSSRTKGRYGAVMFDGKVRQAHHVAFKLTHGYYPTYLRHRCDFGLCCNADAHLIEGTHADNMADKVARGRQAHGPKHGKQVGRWKAAQ